MIKKLFDFLFDNDIDVYFPGQHKGECTSNYVVIKENTTSSLNGITGSGLIDLLFFVPESDYLECANYRKKVKEILENFKDIEFTGNETGPVTDDSVKAYTFSLMYKKYKRI